MVIISILWIPVIEKFQGGELYIYIQAVSSYLAPPIAAVYCLSVLWTRMNECGAFWALTFGLIVGSIRMVLDMIYMEPKCGSPDLRPLLVKNVHYMYFAIILFWLTIVIGIVVSLITDPPNENLVSTHTAIALMYQIVLNILFYLFCLYYPRLANKNNLPNSIWWKG